MVGQGSPQPILKPRRLGAPARFAPVHWLWPLALLWMASLASGAELDVRLRLAWGGGEGRAWQGTIRLSAGQLTDPAPLGLEADVPGSMQRIDGQTLRVFPRTPRNYDGLDLRAIAPADAVLIVELFAVGAPRLAPLEIPLARAARGFQQFDLDDRGNRLLAQRSPGDSMRVSPARESLVFSPGETLEMEVQPAVLDLASSASLLMTVDLLPGRGDEPISSEDYELKTDAEGNCQPLPVKVPLPLVEGVYDVRLALYPKKLTTPLVRGKPLAERRVQIVSVDAVQPVNRAQVEWRPTSELDPANPKWWERMARLPSLRSIPSLGMQPELSSGRSQTHKRLGRSWVELPPQGWQAFPLTIAAPGQPHLLEIEYPSDFAQALGISLIEPNGAGQVGPIGVDSGVVVAEPAVGHVPRVERHRLVFWPQSKEPYVLLVNRGNGPALFGQVKSLAGPAELPPLALPGVSTAGRTLAAWWDKPLVPENFSATDGIDGATGRNFDDWGTFWQAGRRMVQTLQHSGRNAVFLNVVCEGSALYPSRKLEPNPKYDTGVFFENGQDPLRKDVLELMFRLCDRAGIQLVPTVQLAAPLPELEALRLAEGGSPAGIEPLGPDGRTWLMRNGPRRGLGVYYNALDDRVQSALVGVVAELAERYARHASFGGVAIQWTAESYALLPDETGSYDDVTIARFERESGLSIPTGAQPLVARAEFLHGAGEAAWLAWRAERLAGLYRKMHQKVAQFRPGAKLYLAPTELLGSRQIQQALRPSLAGNDDPAGALLLLGIDLARLVQHEGIVVPRPQRSAAGSSPGGQAFFRHWNESASLEKLFATSRPAASLLLHEPAPLRLPGFDAVSPFGAERTHTYLVSQLSAAGAELRHPLIHSLATSDAGLLIEGGWLLPLGQEAALAPLAKVFRRLPNEPFSTAKPKQEASQGVVVRTLARGGKTYFYAVNDTPWPADLEVDFSAPETFRLVSYADERPTLSEQIQSGVRWQTRLEPFDLVGGELSSGKVSVLDYRARFPDELADSLRERVRDVRLRANSLRSPLASNVLSNPSFEQPLAGDAIPGWVNARGRGITVGVDSQQGYRTSSSLHLVSRAGEAEPAPVVWVRSDPFAAPDTGRLSIVAWMKIADPARQPKLRVAIEGKLDGQVYYRFGNIGGSEHGRASKPLSTEWTMARIPLSHLPLAGLTDLRVGFDLMGEGEVWIDEAQVFDRWFEETERDELVKSIAAADVQLGAGDLADCQRFLDGYWPSFLRQNVPLAEPRPTLPEGDGVTARAPPTAGQSPPPAAGEDPSVVERIRAWWSKSTSKLR